MFYKTLRPVPRRLAIGLICGGTFLSLSSARKALSATPAEEVGTVRGLVGQGELGATDPLPPMSTGMPIYLGDRARTGDDSRAQLGFGTSTEVRLGPKSELLIDGFIAASGGVIHLDGSLVFDRPEGSGDPEAVVETQFGRIGVRGTKFLIIPEAEGLGVFVERGLVEVTGYDLAKSSVLLTSGLGTFIPAIGAPPEAAREWGDDRIKSALRYVLGG